MPPTLALVLGYAFVYWLFRQDMRERKLTSSALWVPILWLMVIASKPVSFWLESIGIHSGGSKVEGNHIDLVVFLGLIVASIVILSRRGFSWGEFIAKNKILVLLYVFLVFSSLWAEQSFPTMKRAIKDFGNVSVALVLLTETNPLQAARMMFVRSSYILFPLSIVFIKYYPALGRITGRTGDSFFSGMAWHKSSLGEIVFLCGLFIVLDLMEMHHESRGEKRRLAKWIRYGLLMMGFWLVYTCGSVTALFCFTIGCCVIWGTGRLVRLKNPGLILIRCVAAFLCLFIMEKTFDISDTILHAVGKNKSLTGRTEIWEMAMEAKTPAMLGTGYLAFWNTSYARAIQKEFDGMMNSAHNGFLDMYLDGGFIGLGLLILLMVKWGINSIVGTLRGTLSGRVALMIWVLSIIFNYSETALFRLDPMWFILVVMMIDCPALRRRADISTSAAKAKFRRKEAVETSEVPVPNILAWRAC